MTRHQFHHDSSDAPIESVGQSAVSRLRFAGRTDAPLPRNPNSQLKIQFHICLPTPTANNLPFAHSIQVVPTPNSSTQNISSK